MMNKSIIGCVVAALITSPVFAETETQRNNRIAEEKSQWYKSRAGKPTIRETNKGFLFAYLARSTQDTISLYFTRYEPDDCNKGSKMANGNTYRHDPVYWNGKLVKMSQYCTDSENIVYMPSSTQGMEYLINEFYRMRSVQLKTLDGTILKFSAMGFNAYYNQMKVEKDAI